MEQQLSSQLKNIERKEQKFLQQADKDIVLSALSPMMGKLQDKIPKKLKDTLNTAFYKGFQLVFEKGSPYIEKTYNKDKLELEFDINDYAMDKRMNKRHISRLDRPSKQSALVNSSISVLEGGILGLLGVGLPDIPLFLGVIVKTIYEIALSYGFHYDTPEEKAYILLLISSSITRDEKQKELNKELELLSDKIDRNIDITPDLEQSMKTAAGHLSDSLLAAKFIQGVPLVGAIGGAVNYSIISRTAKFAGFKYKKRYLLKKMNVRE